MIRWVFRPFTQLWASICTSERPSDFHLFFNRLYPSHVKIIIFRVVSELICSDPSKKFGPAECARALKDPFHPIHFHYVFIGFFTIILSTLMHSLIRVTRRDIWRVRFSKLAETNPKKYKQHVKLDSVVCCIATDIIQAQALLLVPKLVALKTFQSLIIFTFFLVEWNRSFPTSP